jgi:hypothetical protein
MKYSKYRLVFFLLLLLGLLAPGIAYAYLDPGTGSYIIQLVIGMVLGGLFAVGLFWRRVMAFFRRLFSGKKNDG